MSDRSTCVRFRIMPNGKLKPGSGCHRCNFGSRPQNVFSEALQSEKTKDAEQRCPVPDKIKSDVAGSAGFCQFQPAFFSGVGAAAAGWMVSMTILALEPTPQLDETQASETGHAKLRPRPPLKSTPA